MRTFHPDSWSKQAREKGDMLYYRLTDGIYDNESQLNRYFVLGYSFDMSRQRRKYVEQRTAKRVYRLIRKGKRK